MEAEHTSGLHQKRKLSVAPVRKKLSTFFFLMSGAGRRPHLTSSSSASTIFSASSSASTTSVSTAASSIQRHRRLTAENAVYQCVHDPTPFLCATCFGLFVFCVFSHSFLIGARSNRACEYLAQRQAGRYAIHLSHFVRMHMHVHSHIS